MNADALLASRRIHWLVFALALLVFATSNLPWQLDDYDQGKQAFTSFEAIEQGHWLFQHTPNAAIATACRSCSALPPRFVEVSEQSPETGRGHAVLAA